MADEEKENTLKVDEIIKNYSLESEKKDLKWLDNVKKSYNKTTDTPLPIQYRKTNIDQYYNFYNCSSLYCDVLFRSEAEGADTSSDDYESQWISLRDVGKSDITLLNSSNTTQTKGQNNNNYFISARIEDSGARKITLELFDRTFYSLQKVIYNAIKFSQAPKKENTDKNTTKTTIYSEDGSESLDNAYRVEANFPRENLRIRWGFTDANIPRSELNDNYFKFENGTTTTSTHRWNEVNSWSKAEGNKAAAEFEANKETFGSSERESDPSFFESEPLSQYNQSSIRSEWTSYIINNVTTTLTNAGMRYTITAIGVDTLILNNYKYLMKYAKLCGTSKELMAYFMKTFNEDVPKEKRENDKEFLRVCWVDKENLIEGFEKFSDSGDNNSEGKTKANERLSNLASVNNKIKNTIEFYKGIVASVSYAPDYADILKKIFDEKTIYKESVFGNLDEVSTSAISEINDLAITFLTECKINTKNKKANDWVSKYGYLGLWKENNNLLATAIYNLRENIDIVTYNKGEKFPKDPDKETFFFNKDQIKLFLTGLKTEYFEELKEWEGFETVDYKSVQEANDNLKKLEKMKNCETFEIDKTLDCYNESFLKNNFDIAEENIKIISSKTTEEELNDIDTADTSGEEEVAKKTTAGAVALIVAGTIVVFCIPGGCFIGLGMVAAGATTTVGAGSTWLGTFIKRCTSDTNATKIINPENTSNQVKYSFLRSDIPNFFGSEKKPIATRIEHEGKNVSEAVFWEDGRFSNFNNINFHSVKQKSSGSENGISLKTKLIDEIKNSSKSAFDYYFSTQIKGYKHQCFFNSDGSYGKDFSYQQKINHWKDVIEKLKNLKENYNNFFNYYKNITNEEFKYTYIDSDSRETHTLTIADINDIFNNNISFYNKLTQLIDSGETFEDCKVKTNKTFKIAKLSSEGSLDLVALQEAVYVDNNNFTINGTQVTYKEITDGKKIENFYYKALPLVIDNNVYLYDTAAGYSYTYFINFDGIYFDTSNKPKLQLHEKYQEWYNGYIKEFKEYGEEVLKEKKKKANSLSGKGYLEIIKSKTEGISKITDLDINKNMLQCNSEELRSFDDAEQIITVIQKYGFLDNNRSSLDKFNNALNSDNLNLKTNFDDAAETYETSIEELTKLLENTSEQEVKLREEISKVGQIIIPLGGEESKKNLIGEGNSSYYKSIMSVFNSYVSQCPKLEITRVTSGKTTLVEEVETTEIDDEGVEKNTKISPAKQTSSVAWEVETDNAEGLGCPVIGFYYAKPNKNKKIRVYNWGPGNSQLHCIKDLSITTASEFGMLAMAAVMNKKDGKSSTTTSEGDTKTTNKLENKKVDFVTSVVTSPQEEQLLRQKMTNGIKQGTITLLPDPSWAFKGNYKPFTTPIYVNIQLPNEKTWSDSSGNGYQECELSGYYVVKSITHEISSNGGSTTLEVMSYPGLAGEVGGEEE